MTPVVQDILNLLLESTLLGVGYLLAEGVASEVDHLLDAVEENDSLVFDIAFFQALLVVLVETVAVPAALKIWIFR